MYNKYGKHHKPLPVKYAYVLESRQNAFPTKPHRPSYVLILNDCQNMNLYGMRRTDVVNQMAIKHSHIRSPFISWYILRWVYLYEMNRTDVMNQVAIKHSHIPLTVYFLVESSMG